VSGAGTGDRVGVVYLARHAEGIEFFQRFVESYKRHAAGLDHDLVVLYKGFSEVRHLNAARGVFAQLPHVGIELPDTGFDIGAYLAAAARLRNIHLCFLNTYAELASDGWLLALYRYASLPAVGIAGAMGSYESMQTTLKISHKVRWLCNEAGAPYDERLNYYFQYVIGAACREWASATSREPLSPWDRLVERAKTLGWRYRSSTSIRDLFGKVATGAALDVEFERRWNVLVSPGGFFSEYARFEQFPNPHVRSNGFMIRRHQLIEFGVDVPRSKMDAWKFESGAQGVTARIRSLGLRAVVVGADGRSFDVMDWADSNSFRLGDQGNLLVTDNQTRKFSAAAAGDRVTQTRLAWGDYAGPAPLDYPKLGVSFAVAPLAVQVLGAPVRPRA
jgi:hypothetical protein